jgi:hypothetical protein
MPVFSCQQTGIETGAYTIVSSGSQDFGHKSYTLGPECLAACYRSRISQSS